MARRHGGKAAGRSPSMRPRISANRVRGIATSACQSALNIDPLSASNIDPSCGREEVVPVVHRGDPRGFV